MWPPAPRDATLGHVIEILVVGVVALLVIAAAAVLGPRLGIAAPLVLVVVGIVASLVPWIPHVEIDPEWILVGVLPPLLYSSAVSMPAMDFRREFTAISGLSVVLVVATSVVLGLFFAWAVPGLGLAWGIALGAIVSPTDAVATSIVKQTSVSRRVIAILDGESLLNDATALVLLRTAIAAAAAAAFSFWGAVGDFAFAVVVAVVIGGAVGLLNLAVRARVTSAPVNTAISFAVPFVASIPAEHFGASGLVAAVVAGLVTGVRAPRVLPPDHRLSDAQNWSTVEFVLEGGVFLVMGLQLASIVGAVEREHTGVWSALLIALGALVVTLAVRAAYVVPLLRSLRASARRSAGMQARVESMRSKLDDPEAARAAVQEHRRGRRIPTARDVERFGSRVRQALGDIAYFRKAPLGWRDGTAVVWAGMRGAVTVAAAQTLPEGTPQRALLVFVAFAVALLSLVLQGLTIGPLMRRISPQPGDTTEEDEGERRRLLDLLRTASDTVPTSGESTVTRAELAAADPTELRAWLGREKARRLAVLRAQRTALLDARDDGTFDAEVLASVLRNLDAEQIALELRGGPGT